MPFVNMICLVCKVDFLGGVFNCRVSKFCSRSCMGKSFESSLINAECITCKKSFIVKSFNRKRKFCSPKCIRYTSDKKFLSSIKGKGFWNNASSEEKLIRMREMFNSRVIKKEGCWGWSRYIDSNGYTIVNAGHGNPILGHRVSWMIHNGPIPDGMFICHHCDNPTCTNPNHLFLGTPKDNMVDCIKKNRKNVSRGEAHYGCKLSDDKVLEIKRLVNLGYSQSKLANMFGVRPSTIQNIVDGRTWKHVY
jgi:hypothetical protein